MCRFTFIVAIVFLAAHQVCLAEKYFENYYDEIDSDSDNGSSDVRNAIRWNINKWPNNRIPYTYTDEYTPAQREIVDRALAYFNENTCLRFEKPDSANDTNGKRMVVFTTKGNRCGTKVGYQTIPAATHNVYLSSLCLTIPGAIQHETMHVVGIFHEQCRSDRDQYIDIDWSNIDMKNYHNFVRIPIEYAKPYDTPYDYGSIMHYSAYAFAKNPMKPTIRVQDGKENPYSRLGQLNKPSAGDIQKINRMYRCPKIK